MPPLDRFYSGFQLRVPHGLRRTLECPYDILYYTQLQTAIGFSIDSHTGSLVGQL
jgi:hypothetical protein